MVKWLLVFIIIILFIGLYCFCIQIDKEFNNMLSIYISLLEEEVDSDKNL